VPLVVELLTCKAGGTNVKNGSKTVALARAPSQSQLDFQKFNPSSAKLAIWTAVGLDKSSTKLIETAGSQSR